MTGEFTLDFSRVRVARSFVFCVVFCTLLFVVLSLCDTSNFITYKFVDTYQIGRSPCACTICHFVAKAVFDGEYLMSLNAESG